MSTRNQPLTIRFTPEEFESLKQQARLNKSKNLAEFVRDKLFMSSDFQVFQINQDMKEIKEGLSTNLYAINANLLTIKKDQDTRAKMYRREFFIFRNILKKIGTSIYALLHFMSSYVYVNTYEKKGYEELHQAAGEIADINQNPKAKMTQMIADIEANYDER